MAGIERTTSGDPAAAVTLAIMYQNLGGWFAIGIDGNRYFGAPEPDAHSEYDRCRVVRMLEALLRSVGSADRDLIFELYADAVIDDRKTFDSRERLQ